VEGETVFSALAELNDRKIAPLPQALLKVIKTRKANPEAYKQKWIKDIEFIQKESIFKGPTFKQ